MLGAGSSTTASPAAAGFGLGKRTNVDSGEAGSKRLATGVCLSVCLSACICVWLSLCLSVCLCVVFYLMSIGYEIFFKIQPFVIVVVDVSATAAAFVGTTVRQV